MADADSQARLASINQHFLSGLLNADAFSPLTLDNFNFDVASTQVAGKVTADIAGTKFSNINVSDTSSVFSNFVNLTDHINSLKNLSPSPFKAPLSNVYDNYMNVLQYCLNTDLSGNALRARARRQDLSGCPLMRKVDRNAVVPDGTAGHSDRVVFDPQGGVTYVTTQPMDASGNYLVSANTKLSTVVNTYTLKRLALYYVLMVNANVLAYDKIMLSVDATSGNATDNSFLDNLFKFTMRQFMELNDLYDNRAMQVQRINTVADASASLGSANALYTVFTDPSGGNIETSLGSWASSQATPGGDHLLYWGVAFLLETPTVGGVVITPWPSDSGARTIALPQVFAYGSAITWASGSTVAKGTANTFDVTALATNAAFKSNTSAVNWSSGQTWSGDPAAIKFDVSGGSVVKTLIVADGDTTNTNKVNLGFKRISVPNGVRPATHWRSASGFSTVLSLKITGVWAGIEDVLYPAYGAVTAPNVGWSTPTKAIYLDGTIAAVMMGDAYWAVAFADKQTVNSVTVFPFADGRPMPNSWSAFTCASDDKVLSDADVGAKVTWTATPATERHDFGALPSPWTWTFKPPLANVRALKIAVGRVGADGRAESYGELGFRGIEINVPSDPTVTGAPMNLMQRMDDLEQGYQDGVASLRDGSVDYESVRKDVRKGERQAAAAAADAKWANRVFLAVAVATALIVAATLVALLLLPAERRLASLAAATVSGVVVAAALAAVLAWAK